MNKWTSIEDNHFFASVLGGGVIVTDDDDDDDEAVLTLTAASDCSLAIKRRNKSNTRSGPAYGLHTHDQCQR
jgi:hypothetical protein